MNAKTIIFALLTTTPSILSAQNLKTYTGPISNNYGAQTGSGTYTYYENLNTHERTKHGTFTFKDQQRNAIGGTYTKLISGNFKSGSKDGTWTYKITYKDYDRVEDITDMQFMATGEVLLTASYKDGMPNGDWLYSNKTKARRASKNIYGEIVYTAFAPAIDMDIRIHFNSGVLTGAFSSQSGQKKLTGTFDSQGRLDKTSAYVTSTQEEVTTYMNGVVLERYVRKNTGEIIDREDFDKTIATNFLNGNASDRGIDESGFSRRNIFKEKIVDLWATIYNNNDFLHIMTSGDKTIVPDNYGGIASIRITGGDFVRLTVKQYTKLTKIYDFKSAQEEMRKEKYDDAIKLYQGILEKNENGLYFINAADKEKVNRQLADATALQRKQRKAVAENEKMKKGLSEISMMFATSANELAEKSFDMYMTRSGEKDRLCTNCTKVQLLGDVDKNGTTDVLIQYVLEPTSEQTLELGKAAIYENDRMFVVLTDERLGTLYVASAAVINTLDIIDYSVYGNAALAKIENGRVFVEKEDRNDAGNDYKEMYWFECVYQNGSKGFTDAKKVTDK